MGQFVYKSEREGDNEIEREIRKYHSRRGGGNWRCGDRRRRCSDCSRLGAFEGIVQLLPESFQCTLYIQLAPLSPEPRSCKWTTPPPAASPPCLHPRQPKLDLGSPSWERIPGQIISFSPPLLREQSGCKEANLSDLSTAGSLSVQLVKASTFHSASRLLDDQHWKGKEIGKQQTAEMTNNQ